MEMQKGKNNQDTFEKEGESRPKMHLKKKIKVNRLALSGTGIYCRPMIME